MGKNTRKEYGTAESRMRRVGCGGADEKWKKEELLKHFTEEEKQSAIDLYVSEKLTTQGVVDPA